MNDAEILHIWDSFVNEPSAKYPLTDADKIRFARALFSRKQSTTGSIEESGQTRVALLALVRECEAQNKRLEDEIGYGPISPKVLSSARDMLEQAPEQDDSVLDAIEQCLLHEEPDLALVLEIIHNSKAVSRRQSAVNSE